MRSNKYLFAVKALSKVFRAKYVQQLRAADITDQLLIESLFQKQWVVYAKRPFGGPRQVTEYLGRYTHKVAISNHRISSVNDHEVSFTYKDYHSGRPQKTMTLANEEFVNVCPTYPAAWFCTHQALWYFKSSTWKRGKLKALQQSLQVEAHNATPVKTLLRRCPCCKTGTLVTIEIFGKRGPQEKYLLPKQTPLVD